MIDALSSAVAIFAMPSENRIHPLMHTYSCLGSGLEQIFMSDEACVPGGRIVVEIIEEKIVP